MEMEESNIEEECLRSFPQPVRYLGTKSLLLHFSSRLLLTYVTDKIISHPRFKISHLARIASLVL